MRLLRPSVFEIMAAYHVRKVALRVAYQKGFTAICSFLGNNDLCGAVVGKQCPGQPPFPPPPPFTPPPPQTASGQQGKKLGEILSDTMGG